MRVEKKPFNALYVIANYLYLHLLSRPCLGGYVLVENRAPFSLFFSWKTQESRSTLILQVVCLLLYSSLCAKTKEEEQSSTPNQSSSDLFLLFLFSFFWNPPATSHQAFMDLYELTFLLMKIPSTSIYHSTTGINTSRLCRGSKIPKRMACLPNRHVEWEERNDLGPLNCGTR